MPDYLIFDRSKNMVLTMKERDPQAWEKDHVRDTLRQAVQCNATAEEMRQIRHDLARTLGLTYPQIQAIGAWKKGQDGQTLELKKTPVATERTEEAVGESSTSPTAHVQVQPEPSQTLTDISPQTETTCWIREGSEFTDYDFPEKREWRKRWGE